jgi:hypothetical protein
VSSPNAKLKPPLLAERAAARQGSPFGQYCPCEAPNRDIPIGVTVASAFPARAVLNHCRDEMWSTWEDFDPAAVDGRSLALSLSASVVRDRSLVLAGKDKNAKLAVITIGRL